MSNIWKLLTELSPPTNISSIPVFLEWLIFTIYTLDDLLHGVRIIYEEQFYLYILWEQHEELWYIQHNDL